jgi:DNA-binding response OmpR family regulator
MLPLLRRKVRLLLLDDDPGMQRLIPLLLKRAGYRVDVVSAGAQAIEKIAETEYGALLLDLMTPTEGGLTVIRHLKESNPALLRRVIVVTASPDSVLKRVEGDVAAIVQKPFEAETLLAAVESVMASA